MQKKRLAQSSASGLVPRGSPTEAVGWEEDCLRYIDLNSARFSPGKSAQAGGDGDIFKTMDKYAIRDV